MKQTQNLESLLPPKILPKGKSILKMVNTPFSKTLVLSIPLLFCTGFSKLPSDNWKCPKCGYENLEGISRCGICGTLDS